MINFIDQNSGDKNCQREGDDDRNKISDDAISDLLYFCVGELDFVNPC